MALNSWTDIQEESFVKCLREIEKTYVHLPKTLRIRTEKWVEKLVSSSCANVTWKKHRNAYARLLLNTVVTRNFTEPFHTLPPNGPLPSFPAHVKAFGKDLLGPHETRFWRGVFEQAQERVKENPPFEEISLPAESAVSKEIRNLNLLIREQAQRIQLLEQQIRDERSKYELELQRGRFSHRLEITKAQDSVSSLPITPPRREYPVEDRFSSQTTNLPPPPPPSNPGLSSSSSSAWQPPSFPHPSIPDMSAPQRSTSPFTGRAYDTRIRSSASDYLSDSGNLPRSSYGDPPISAAALPIRSYEPSPSASSSSKPVNSFPLPTFLTTTTAATPVDRSLVETAPFSTTSTTLPRWEGDVSLGIEHVQSSPTKDLLPKPRIPSLLAVALSEERPRPRSHPSASSTSSSSGGRSPHAGLVVGEAQEGGEGTEEFLSSLEQFQSQVRRLRLDDEQALYEGDTA